MNTRTPPCLTGWKPTCTCRLRPGRGYPLVKRVRKVEPLDTDPSPGAPQPKASILGTVHPQCGPFLHLVLHLLHVPPIFNMDSRARPVLIGPLPGRLANTRVAMFDQLRIVSVFCWHQSHHCPVSLVPLDTPTDGPRKSCTHHHPLSPSARNHAGGQG